MSAAHPVLRHRRLLVWGILLVLGFVAGGVMAQQLAPLDFDALDRYVQEQMDANHTPGLALAISRGDQVLYLKGYGTAGDGRPVTPRTQFLIASLSKSFTALAVMQLVEDGLIALDAPVRTYLPEFAIADPDAADRITVRHLLNHTSGLADAGFPSYVLPQPSSIEERVLSLRDARLVSQPGTAFHYFNPNYEVLARIVEVTSGESFDDYLARNVFMPLAMANTTAVVTSGEAARGAPGIAQGYVLAFGFLMPADELDGYLAGSGGVISTAEDLANYLIMQNGDGRFRDEVLAGSESMRLMHAPPGDIDSTYAMGWIARSLESGRRVIEHNGVLSVFHADAFMLPDDGYGVALLYNYSHTFVPFEGIKGGVMQWLAGTQPSTGGLGAGTLGLITGALMLVTISLQVRSLLRLASWAARASSLPAWRLVLGVARQFIPVALVAGMSPLVGVFSGRVFSYPQLFRSLPEVMTWLTLSSVLGTISGVARLDIIARKRHGKHA